VGIVGEDQLDAVAGGELEVVAALRLLWLVK
jgi:hypothetical protein